MSFWLIFSVYFWESLKLKTETADSFPFVNVLKTKVVEAVRTCSLPSLGENPSKQLADLLRFLSSSAASATKRRLFSSNGGMVLKGENTQNTGVLSKRQYKQSPSRVFLFLSRYKAEVSIFEVLIFK